jgi:hypothetical protein
LTLASQPHLQEIRSCPQEPSGAVAEFGTYAADESKGGWRMKLFLVGF